MSHLDEGQLNALLDGELAETERKTAEAHLESCAECRREYAEARALMAGADDLIAAVDLPTRSGPPAAVPKARPGTFRWRNVAWAASILCAVGLGWLARSDQLISPESGRYAKDLGDAAAAPATPQAAPSPAPVTPGDSLRSNEKRAADPANGGLAFRVGSADQKAVQPGPPPAARDESRVPAVEPGTPPAKLEDGPAAVAKENAPGAGTDGLQALTNRADKAADNTRDSPTLASAEGRLARKTAQEEQPAALAERALAASQAPSQTAPMESAASGFAAAAPVPAGRRDRAAEAFRATPMEAAVRILGGSIRLVDGMTPTRVMVGPGLLVRGADPGLEIVRVVYDDPPGRELWLDQQRPRTGVSEADREGLGAVTTLLPGDTLVVIYKSGEHGLRWIHQSGFRLGLTGFLPADSLRALARRVQ